MQVFGPELLGLAPTWRFGPSSVELMFASVGYQETIRYRGRDVAVREPDGVHLDVAGTVIEAREAGPAVRAALRAPRARPTTAPSG